jgi:hypothetical protein
MALLFRAAGRDALHLRRRSAGSFWEPKRRAGSPREYFRQF